MPVAKQVMGFAEYLRKCDTPLTISVQGKWGSGKTSFFQLTKEFILEEQRQIKAALKAQKNAKGIELSDDENDDDDEEYVEDYEYSDEVPSPKLVMDEQAKTEIKEERKKGFWNYPESVKLSFKFLRNAAS